MCDESKINKVRATGRLLDRLLLEREEYRMQWQYHQQRRPGTGVNRAAVAEVISGHLYDMGERPDSTTARHIKDRVGRAIAGQVLSSETLRWFIEAFRMSPEDQDLLREAFAHGRTTMALPPVNTLQKRQSLPRPQRHRTVMLFERRIIDATGQAVSHHSQHTIMAREDGVDRYPCFLSSRLANVIMVHGGQVEKPCRPPLIEIVLSRSLRQGETTSFAFERAFQRIDGVDTEYRRVANELTQNLDIVVQFDPRRLPSRVWWTEWDDHQAGNVLQEELVTLDGDHRAHCFLPYMMNAAAGFRWTW
ncbi:hypothetical protein ABZ917_32480 [Nonomuraea wenchangensis]